MSFLTEYFDEFRQHAIRKTQMCRPENRWAQIEGYQWLDPKVGTEDKAWTEEEIEKFIKATMKSLRGQSTYYNEFCAHLDPELKTRPFKPREKKCRPKVEAAAEEAPPPPPPKLAMKDTELMKVAKELYEPDVPKPVLEPLKTHFRRCYLSFIHHYVRPHQASSLGRGPPRAEYVSVWTCHVHTDRAEARFPREAARLVWTRLFAYASRVTYSHVLGYARDCFFRTGISDYQQNVARLAYELIRDDRIPRYHAHNGCRPRWGLPPEGTRQPELDGAPYDGERLY